MENAKISSLNLPEATVQKLASHSVNTLKDLLSKPETELIKILNTSYAKVQSIVDTALRNELFVARPVTALDLFENEHKEESKDNFDPREMFAKIVNETGIFKVGMICEPDFTVFYLSLRVGCGKTQLSMQLCSLAFFSLLNDSKDISIIYIDTENNLSAKRLMEIARSRYVDKSEEELMLMAKSVHAYKVFTVSDLEKAIRSVEYDIIMKNARVIIIDSIAALVRREFFEKDSKTSIERAKFLMSVSSKLKKIAHNLEVSVFLTNQISVSYSTAALVSGLENLNCQETENEDDVEDGVEEIKPEYTSKVNFEEEKIIPALGYTWGHFVNIRLTLQYIDENERELIITKSPFTANMIYRYRISATGLEFSGHKRTYEGESLNEQKIKTKSYDTH